MEFQLRNSFYPDYVYGVLLLGLILMIILKIGSQFSLFHASRNFFIPTMEDSRPNKAVYTLAGIVLFALSISLSLQLYVSVFQFRHFLYTSGGVLSYFLLRYLVLGTVSFVSENPIVFRLQSMLSYDFLFVSAIIIFTLNVFNIFSSCEFKYQFHLPIVLIVLSYLIWLIQISVQIIRHHINTLYLILYLCAFEILPLVLLFKVFIGKI
jgi:hypothetical protein